MYAWLGGGGGLLAGLLAHAADRLGILSFNIRIYNKGHNRKNVRCSRSVRWSSAAQRMQMLVHFTHMRAHSLII